MKRNQLIIGLALLAGISVLPEASATITFDTGNQQYNNVNFVAAQSAPTVTGYATIGGQDLAVYFLNGVGPDGFTSINLHAQHGVAFVENVADAASSTPQIGFSSITIKPQEGYGFTAGDFKIDEINSGSLQGLVTLYGVDQFGNVTHQIFDLSPHGQNPFQFWTGDGELVTSLTFTTPTDSLMADIKQVSVNMAPVIPEPTTVASVAILLVPMGLGLISKLKKATKS